MSRKRYTERIVEKYRTVYTCPIPSNGLSTDLAPIQVRITMIEIRAQNFIFLVGENLVGLFFLRIKGARIIIDAARAATPPSFDGIDRNTT